MRTPSPARRNCVLGPFWMERLRKSEFTAYQASPRGGVVHVAVDTDSVRLAGHAVTVFRGTIVNAALPK